MISGEVLAAGKQWESVFSKVLEPKIYPTLFFAYANGEYFFVDMYCRPELRKNYQIDIGDKLLSISGQDPHSYVKKLADKTLLEVDVERNYIYSRILQITSPEVIEIETRDGKLMISLEKDRLAQDLEGSSKTSPPIKTAILVKDRMAYLYVSQMWSYTKDDKKVIYDFLKSVSHYPVLIIDIRGNGGGSVTFWRENLVSPLINKPLSATFFITYRRGEYVKRFLSLRNQLAYLLKSLPLHTAVMFVITNIIRGLFTKLKRRRRNGKAHCPILSIKRIL